MSESSDCARVLVVDDDAAALEATRTMLHVAGYEVRGAQNGALGLEEVITFRPEVVVFDFWMPVADGRDLLQGIREVARARIGLVAMSGTPEVEDWCGRVGVGYFVRKPFQHHTLLDAVVRALDDARTASTRLRPSSAIPASRRLGVERAVLVVGEPDVVRGVRNLLREGPRPVQVAIVADVADACRALGSFQLDAICVLGARAAAHAALGSLFEAARARALPVVADRPVGFPEAVVSDGLEAERVVATLLDTIAGPRSSSQPG
jgi:CheY-like chemotaxis protein